MRVHQRVFRSGEWTTSGLDPGPASQLVFVFSSTAQLTRQATWDQLRTFYPQAHIVACSTAGEIADTQVFDDSIVCTSITFEGSATQVASVQLNEATDGEQLGALLVSRLPRAGLVHVFVLSDGLKVNGSALVKGITSQLPDSIGVSGGLSGDGANFQRTAVCLDRPEPSEQVIAVGFYGARLKVGLGSLGGWDPFGAERRITRSEGNVLYELDGEPALDLYKRYLAEHAAALPASGLRFPLAIRGNNEADVPVVRTILAVDEKSRSLTFAGDVPTGYRARLMRANFERLVEGACGAAKAAQQSIQSKNAQLAILISCVGRKLVLQQRVEEEVEAVRDVIGPDAVITGFYSYGELAPFTSAARCELHNQTMTITTLSEG